MIAFIDEHRGVYGGRAICRVLPIAPSTYHVLDALEQALHSRQPFEGGGLVHHSDRGAQYLSIKDTERLAEAASSPPSAASATATTTRSLRP